MNTPEMASHQIDAPETHYYKCSSSLTRFLGKVAAIGRGDRNTTVPDFEFTRPLWTQQSHFILPSAEAALVLLSSKQPEAPED